MSYKSRVYVAMDADNDLIYYNLMKAWKQNDNIPFYFNDAHDLNNILDVSEESIKRGLQERFRNTKVFVLLVGEHTRYKYKYVRWEIEQAIKRNIPCIVVNINGKRSLDEERCPSLMKNALAIHISYNAKILQYALEHWPRKYEQLLKNNETGAYYYVDAVYEKLGL